MRAPSKNITASAATAITFIVALVLSGCANSPLAPTAKPVNETASAQPTEELIDDSFDNADDSDSFDWTDGGLDSGDFDFDFDFGDIESGNTVPKDFPKSIPLYKGQVKEGVALTIDGKRMWTITMNVPDISKTYASTRSGLQAAGFDEFFAVEDAESALGMFDANGFSVYFTIEKSNNGFELAYVVTED